MLSLGGDLFMPTTFDHAQLKVLRRQAGITREAVAMRFGRTYSSVADWESGRTRPPVDLLPEIAALYGVGISDLFNQRPAR
jgi:transcriptional regulator with XRE-family HTH domain